MSVGIHIKKRRSELKMTQQELAAAMGYKTRSTIAKIEAGENDVSQKKLRQFALVLDTTPEALLSGFPNHAVPPAEPSSEHARKHIVIILAGGKSGRNHQNIPSQFVSIQGKPIIVYCMETYQSHPSIDDIYVVCLKGWEDILNAYAKQFGISKLRGILPGGPSGILSLKNGLDTIRSRYSQDDIIIVQEATRPMVNTSTVSNLLHACYESSSATICHSMNDYVQFSSSGGKVRYLDRNSIIALQSPEAHRLRLMCEVFDKATACGHPLTESCCTMLLYNLGYDINFIEGNFNNIKITREEDFATFRALVRE